MIDVETETDGYWRADLEDERRRARAEQARELLYEAEMGRRRP